MRLRLAAGCLFILAFGALVASHATHEATTEASQVVFGPRQFLRTTGSPNRYDETFAIPTTLRAPFVLLVVNGDAKGQQRVSSASVSLNGVEILKPKDFSQKVGAIDREVELRATNVLRVTLASGPGGYITIRVMGAPRTSLALTPDPLSVVVGSAATLTATITPPPTGPGRLTVTSATPGVATVPASVAYVAGQVSVPVPVTALAAGSSVVTVSLHRDGRDDDETRVSASATIVVTRPVPPPNRAPVAHAGGPYAGETNQPIAFAGTATDPDDDALTFAWAFGDGTSGSGASPTHAYGMDGTFTATLTVSDGRGGVASATSGVVVTPPPPPPPVNRAPSANAGGPYAVTAGQPLTFTGSGTDPDGDRLAFSWTFGDGANGAGASATHVYAAAGDYTATLTVDDGRGGSTTATAMVAVTPIPPPANRAPTATAGGPYAGETTQLISFAGNGSDPDGDTLTFTWDFGDGASGNGASATHAYATAGIYAATLTVNDGRGGTATATATVAVTSPPPPPPVNRAPSANAGGPYAGETARVITFAGSGSDPDGDPLTFTWDFGDGASGSGASASHAYAAAGTYPATLTVNDGRGGTVTATTSVVVTSPPPPPVNRAPSANAGGPYASETSQVITFAGSGSDPDGDPLTFTWDFGDGASGSGASATHAYATVGTYTAALTANDGRGGAATATTSVAVTSPPPPPPVNRAPSANAGGPYAGPMLRPIALAASGVDPDGDPLVFTWEFGDGGTGAGASVTHTYTNAGEFAVRVTVSDGRGGSTVATSSASISSALNSAPTLTSAPVRVAAHQRPYGYQATAIDTDGDAVVFSLAEAPSGMTVGAATGLVTWTPGALQLGVRPVALVATDVFGASSTQSFDITVTDDTSPVVTVSLPSEVLPGSTAVATALAADDIGVVAVRFEVNGADAAEVTTAPFSRTVVVPANTLVGTEFHVRAIARDGAGNTGVADRVFKVAATPDVQPPVLSLNVAPQASPGATVRLSVTATDNVGIKSVTFRMGGTPIGTDSEAPFEATFAVPADAAIGAFVEVAARAVDFSDNFTDRTGTLQVVAAPDTTPPFVQLVVAPTVLEGGTATLAATAADNIGVASVAFLVNGVVVGTVANEPYRMSFPLPVGLSGGDVLGVEARAVDFSGLVSSSAGAIEVLANPNRAPTANAGGPYTGELGALIHLSAGASSDPDATDHLHYDWDFGDQSTGTGLSPSHAYATEGSFTVTVTVSDGRGGASASQAAVAVTTATDRDPPSISLNGPASVLPGSQVTITAQASDDRGVVGVAFEVNGGAPADAPGPPYQRVVAVPSVASPGDRITVRATARDAAGNRSSADRTLTIGSVPDTENPTVAINAPPSVAGGTTMTLSATVSDNVGVQSVSFTVNGVVVATLVGPPFEALYPVAENAAAGSSIGIVVRATDFSGNGGEASRVVAVVQASESDTTPPTISLSAPLQVYAGRTIPLYAQAADNVGVASVRFFVNGVNVSTLNGPPFAFTYTLAPSQAAGTVLALRADVTDLSGLSATDGQQTLIVSAASAGQGGVTGEVYVDVAGLPLEGATVRLVGIDTTGEPYTVSTVTDAQGRWVLRATEGQGIVRIGKPGWTSVDRATPVIVNQAIELIDARLTQLAAPSTSVSAVLGGAVSWPVGPGPPATLTVPPGALPTATHLALTPLTQQGLAGLLPAGWSPVAVADITPREVSFATGATLSLPNAFSIAGGETLVVARWDAEAAAWRTVGSLVAPSMGSLVAEVVQGGQYAVLRPDAAPTEPPSPVAGELLAGIAISSLALDASTLVDPQPRVLFYRPGVRSDVRGSITAPAPIASGLPIEARIVESYAFVGGTNVRPEPFVEDLVFYQVGGPASGLGASFGVTPSQSFDPLTLQQGVITVELRAPPIGPRVIATLGPDGGLAAAAGGETLQVPQGAVADPLPVSVRGLTAANFGITLPAGIHVEGAALVTFAGTLGRSATLSAPKPAALATTARLLLVRAQEIGGETKLVLVARGVVIGNRLQSDTTLNGADVFAGIRVGGRYFFVSAASAFGFARGQVIAPAGGPFAGALVTADGFPIVSLSGLAGDYVAAASVGAVALTARDLVNADTGVAAGDLAGAGAIVPLNLQITASLPRVTAVTPADGAANVALSDPIVIRFSKAMAAASINGSNAGNVRLVKPDGSPVVASISLAGTNSLATLRPAGPLQPNTVYTVVVSTGVTDLSGRSLPAEVTTQFTSLDTEPPPMPAAGGISAAIPGSDGFTTISGTQGTAATHDTVTVINVTQHTTTTVLLDSNGGFTVRVAASLTDKLQIVITDAHGNQTVVPLARFTRTNADGSVSVFVGPEGGRVEGAGGTAVDLFEGTFPGGAVVTIKPVTEAAFPVQLSPENRALFAYSGGFEVDFNGATPTRYVNVSVPSAPGDSVDDQWLVGQVTARNGQLMLNMIDTAKLIGGRVTTSSPPCPGVTAAGVYGVHKSSRPVGMVAGTMTSDQAIASDFSPEVFAAFGSNAPFCLPVLTGRVTVTLNTVTLGIWSTEILPGDELVAIKNVRTGSESRFNLDDLAYAVSVPGSVTDEFNVLAVSPGNERSVDVRVVADQPGLVKVLVPLDAVMLPVTALFVDNLTTSIQTTVSVGTLEVALEAAGGAADGYSVTVSSSLIGPRPVLFTTTPSLVGLEHLVLRAQAGTIDPTLAEVIAYNAANPTTPIVTSKFRTRVMLVNLTLNTRTEVPATRIVNGGFAWAFDGDLSQSFRVEVEYANGEVDVINIPVFRITVTNAAGTPVQTITLPSPPIHEPKILKVPSDDTMPPALTTLLSQLQNFDPSGILTLTFNESLDLDSIVKNFRVLDLAGAKVDGKVIISHDNHRVTFVPTVGLALGEKYTIRLLGLVDLNNNPVDPSRNYLLLATMAPRKVAELRLGTSPVRTLEGLKDMQIQRKMVGGQLQTTLVAVTDAASGVGFKVLAIDVTDPKAPVETGRGSGGATQQRLTLLPDVASLALAGENPCSTTPGSNVFTGDLGLTTTYNMLFSFVSFYDVTDRTRPCLLGNRLLSANPQALSTFSSPGTVHAVGYARGVAAIQHAGSPASSPPVPPGFMAYTAVSEIGIFPIDISRNIPEILPANRVRGPVLAGDYIDVAAVSNRLVALNRGTQQLEVVDPNLTVLSAVDIPDRPRRLLYVPRLPYDANHNGAIEPGEYIDAGVIGADRSVIIVDLTNILSPRVVSSIPLPAIVRDVDVDRAKLRMFAVTDTAWYIVDLGKKQLVGLVDVDFNGIDDRVAWSRTSADVMYSVKVDTNADHIYLGTAKGLDVYNLGAPNLTGVAEYTYFKMLRRPGGALPPSCAAGTASPAQCGGLDLLHPEMKPIRGARVELQRASDSAVLATTYTDAIGYYAFHAPVGPQVKVVVKAVLGSPGLETVRVVDNTNGDKVWEYADLPFALAGLTQRNIYAATIWKATPVPAAPALPSPSYGPRDSAPFAILDTVYEAQTKVREAEPSIIFPPLKIEWSFTNTGAGYDPDRVTLTLGGSEDIDTDEYDAQVVLHEWFHYFVHQFGRSDSVRGNHRAGEILDPRLAFNEGFATAFAAMVTTDTYYADTKGIHQFVAIDQDVEEDSAAGGGFFDEDTVVELIWDLFDGKMSTEADKEGVPPIVDDVELGFKRLYQALRKQRTAPTFVTIFSFLKALPAPILADPALVALAKAENIDVTNADEYEQSNIATIKGVMVGPLYTVVPADTDVPPDGTLITEHGPGPFNPGPATMRQLQTRVASGAVILDPAGDGNKLYGHVFFKVEIANAGIYIVEATPVGLNRKNEALELTVNQSGVIRKFNDFNIPYNTGIATATTPLVLQPGTYVVSVRGTINFGNAWVPGPAPFTLQVRLAP